MKKLIILLSIFVAFMLVMPAEAQRVRQLADVQVDAVETLYSGTITISGGYATLSVDILCTEDGGTTDGSIFLQVRNGSGGNWQTIGPGNYSEFMSLNDPDSLMAMTDGKIFQVVLNPAPFAQYRFGVTGTASDTTTVTFDYLINYLR